VYLPDKILQLAQKIVQSRNVAATYDEQKRVLESSNKGINDDSDRLRKNLGAFKDLSTTSSSTKLVDRYMTDLDAMENQIQTIRKDLADLTQKKNKEAGDRGQLEMRCSLCARSRFFREDSLVPSKNSVLPQ
jgi:chromosome segregation ATPase